MIDIIKTLSPAILTVLLNIVFYLWIKSRVDKSMERHKIAFSGIFKERIDIYREILRLIYGILSSLSVYQYSGNAEETKRIGLDINKLINYSLINQMFLSETMLCELHKIREEFQLIFEDFSSHYYISTFPGIDANSKIESTKKFYAAANKLKSRNYFKTMEDTIIKEMKADLQVDNL